MLLGHLKGGMPENAGDDVGVVRVLDGDGGGGDVAESMRAEGLTEGAVRDLGELAGETLNGQRLPAGGY